MKATNDEIKVLAENRRARHDYAIEDSYECGIELKGSEVKSVRARHLSFADSYALVKNGQIFLIGLRIEPYPQATHDVVDPDRTRKLLLKRKEIDKIERILKIGKMNLIPLKLYLKEGLVKVQLGLGKGKSKVDKRDTIKERESKIELSRVLKRG
jgi:SsrA-binding protein